MRPSLNLEWINTVSEIQPLLDDFKQKSNHRPSMAFGYMSPVEKLADFFKKRNNVEKFKKMKPLKFVGV